MKLTFLGSGGGRFSAISQRRMTGGFRIDNLGGKNYHIDPGPGALVRTYQFGFDPRNLSGVIVTHSHTYHYNDAERGAVLFIDIIKCAFPSFERGICSISMIEQNISIV